MSAILGGALIAAGLATLLIATGRIAGLAGILAGLLAPGDRAWRGWFVAGMLAAGAGFAAAAPATFDASAPAPLWLVGCSGLLVGVGTRLANGCTSGHGLCGTSRLAPRSFAATGTFFAIAVLTATFLGSLRT